MFACFVCKDRETQKSRMYLPAIFFFSQMWYSTHKGTDVKVRFKIAKLQRRTKFSKLRMTQKAMRMNRLPKIPFYHFEYALWIALRMQIYAQTSRLEPKNAFREWWKTPKLVLHCAQSFVAECVFFFAVKVNQPIYTEEERGWKNWQRVRRRLTLKKQAQASDVTSLSATKPRWEQR